MTEGPFHSPNTHPLKYDRVRFKASHNSYAMPLSLEEQLSFDRDRPDRRGFRGLELDIHQNMKGCDWCVRHLVGGCKKPRKSRHESRSPKDGCLGTWLRQLVSWSDKNPEHDVVTLTLDAKHVDDEATFGDEFDAFLSSCGLDESRLFTPGEFSQSWPTLGDLCGKFIACLSGSEGAKSTYAKSEHRLCFSDFSVKPGGRPKKNDLRLFLNYNWRAYERDIGNVFRRPTGRPYITRAYGLRRDPVQGSWSGAEKARINIMTTDWRRSLSVGREPFGMIV